MSIKYPSMRAELADYTRAVGNSSPLDVVNSEADLNCLVHFLFDDTCLSTDAGAAVGLFLENQEEVACVEALVSATDRFLEAFPQSNTPEHAFADPLWREVVVRSRAVADLIETGSP